MISELVKYGLIFIIKIFSNIKSWIKSVRIYGGLIKPYFFLK
jgi:hypothetical protein